MSAILPKDEAHRLIDSLPENASWEDLMHEIYVRETIERGIADSEATHTREGRDIRADYGLPE